MSSFQVASKKRRQSESAFERRIGLSIPLREEGPFCFLTSLRGTPASRLFCVAPPRAGQNDASIELTLSHRLEGLDFAQSVAERLCESVGADGDAFPVGMAVREAAANAFKHGNRFDARKRVRVVLDLRGTRLTVRIRDDGRGFDPEQTADPLQPENRMKASGRGLFLMRKFMDQVVFSRGEDGGHEVLMSKALTCQMDAGSSPPPRSRAEMKVTSRSVQGVEILNPEGKITIGVGDIALREAVQESLARGAKKLLLDMSGVTTVDSSGIGELVSAYTRVNNQGGKLKLLNLPPKVQDILTITQLITVFEVYDSETEAVESFS
ncbi:anti-sigma factor antagonist [Stigmatella sp. ncwal1]|uniref:Anti-sigma factor antagonist n=1 Tax=Stigmatella ashevillensis TaxID=2995309 RepID=A0ABT5DBB5_9BACT|nr:anti-sigma factor antagonist [Stigmatella ashevillena]MDC0710947.1 anti-sigma factor antagonist [Stigmatella ashevillena]